MNQPNFREFAAGRIVLLDGAMGTRLYQKGVFIHTCFDEVTLSNPKLVRDIHKEYVDAGADVIETNTFGANRFKLLKYGFESQAWAINSQAARLAREAAGGRAYVAGAVGPLGIRIEPWGKTSLEEAHDVFREQVEALLSGGVDLFILETFSDLAELGQAVSAIRGLCDLPIVAQITIDREGNGIFGTPPEVFAKKMANWETDWIGLNCAGPQVVLDTLERMRGVTDRPLSAVPNAGNPRTVDDRLLYMAGPEYMAEFARRFIAVGATMVGGCCGTDPACIQTMRSAIKAVSPAQREIQFVVPEFEEGQEVTVVPREEKSKFAAKLCRGEFAVTVELTPPKSPDLTKIIEASRSLAETGIVDAINIPDGPRASSRVSPLATAVTIEREAGIETILHYCCRDRNLLGMQSDLLGACSLGLRNLLVITGDPPKMGDYPNATAVFDVDAIGLTNVINFLNHGRDIGSNRVDPPTSFLIGIGVNPGALDLEKEIARFEWKVKAGAEFAVTQPVFDPEQLKDFLERIAHVRIPVLAGIWPLVSLKNAEFMHNEVPGVHVPEHILKRMRAAGDVQAQREVGVELSIEILKAVRPMIEGVQISAPFGRVKVVQRILKALQED